MRLLPAVVLVCVCLVPALLVSRRAVASGDCHDFCHVDLTGGGGGLSCSGPSDDSACISRCEEQNRSRGSGGSQATPPSGYSSGSGSDGDADADGAPPADPADPANPSVGDASSGTSTDAGADVDASLADR